MFLIDFGTVQLNDYNIPWFHALFIFSKEYNIYQYILKCFEVNIMLS